MQISGDGVQMIDRMKTNRMIARNALMKELERSQRKVEKSKAAAGKSRSSRNVFRHGLSQPMPLDTTTEQRLAAMMQAIIADGSADEYLSAYTEAAQAQLDLLRISKARADMVVELGAPIEDSRYISPAVGTRPLRALCIH